MTFTKAWKLDTKNARDGGRVTIIVVIEIICRIQHEIELKIEDDLGLTIPEKSKLNERRRIRKTEILRIDRRWPSRALIPHGKVTIE